MSSVPSFSRFNGPDLQQSSNVGKKYIETQIILVSNSAQPASFLTRRQKAEPKAELYCNVKLLRYSRTPKDSPIGRNGREGKMERQKSCTESEGRTSHPQNARERATPQIKRAERE